VSVFQMESNPKLQHRRVSTSCQGLDDILRGGIPTKSLTEVVGESSSGKTQFCLQVALQCSLPCARGGLQGKTLYISTNGDFPSSRYKQMGQALIKREEQSGYTPPDPFSQIYPVSAPDLTELWTILTEKLPGQLNRASANIKLIVIDSIASLIRSEHTGAVERARSLWLISSQLRQLADLHNIAVIVVNQVTDKFDEHSRNVMGPQAEGKLLPSMGLSWAKCITTRIIISRTRRQCEVEQTDNNPSNEPPSKKVRLDTISVPVRNLKIVFSSSLPAASQDFLITPRGLEDVLVDESSHV